MPLFDIDSEQDDFAHDLHLGHSLTLLGRLGEGPRGESWLGLDEVRGSEVVVKVLRGVSTLDFDKVNAELSRIRPTLAPNIVPWSFSGLIGEGEASGPALVRDFVAADNLAHTLRAQPQSPRGALSICALVAAQLVQLHAQDLLFLSLRPNNIVLTTGASGEEVLLLDGLLAESLHGLVHGADASVNDAYKAPELRAGAPPSARCDVYALGMLLREMVPAEDPLTGPIIERCTPVRPADRYPTMAALRETIELALQQSDAQLNARAKRRPWSWLL